MVIVCRNCIANLTSGRQHLRADHSVSNIEAFVEKQDWSGGREREMRIDRGVAKGKKTVNLKREAYILMYSA